MGHFSIRRCDLLATTAWHVCNVHAKSESFPLTVTQHIRESSANAGALARHARATGVHAQVLDFFANAVLLDMCKI